MDEWTAELYVHAMAVEEEAERRYAQLARRMADLGDADAAILFAEFSVEEARHLKALCKRTQRERLPALSSDYTWADIDIETALQAEGRAHAFFEHARRVALDPEAIALAEEMSAEEMSHLVRIAQLTENRLRNPRQR